MPLICIAMWLLYTASYVWRLLDDLGHVPSPSLVPLVGSTSLIIGAYLFLRGRRSTPKKAGAILVLLSSTICILIISVLVVNLGILHPINDYVEHVAGLLSGVLFCTVAVMRYRRDDKWVNG